MAEPTEPRDKHGPIWHFMWDKPKGWDEPANYFGRIAAAVILGLALIGVRLLNH